MDLVSITLSLGRYAAPLVQIIENFESASKDMMAALPWLEAYGMNMTNSQQMLENFSGIEGIDPSKILEEIIAPLSFYRGVIKSKAKDLKLIQDNSTYDLVMDLGFSVGEDPLVEIGNQINELDTSTTHFFECLITSSN